MSSTKDTTTSTSPTSDKSRGHKQTSENAQQKSQRERLELLMQGDKKAKLSDDRKRTVCLKCGKECRMGKCKRTPEGYCRYFNGTHASSSNSLSTNNTKKINEFFEPVAKRKKSDSDFPHSNIDPNIDQIENE